MKKGFTLAELLGVIVVLGIIALIITPVVTDVLNDSEQKSYEKQVDMIEKVAKEFGVENNDLLPEPGNLKIITLDDLMESGKIQNSKIIDPRTKEEMSGCVVVSYNADYNQYEYKYKDNKSDCSVCIYQGTDQSKKYAYGAKYTCHLDTDRTFYVLENNEENESISLLMDRNFTDDIVPQTLGWCTDGGADNTTCKNINSKDRNPLKHIQDTFGDNVEVSFPTKDQITSANNGSTSNLPQWLYDHLDGTPNPESGVYGYWTVSPDAEVASFAWIVGYNGSVGSDSVGFLDDYGVRPVITVSKKLL